MDVENLAFVLNAGFATTSHAPILTTLFFHSIFIIELFKFEVPQVPPSCACCALAKPCNISM